MRTDPSKADENKTEKVKRFRKTLQNILLCTDHVFKGQLLNVVQCLTCGNKSEMTENFWDLSLPIVSKNVNLNVKYFIPSTKEKRHTMQFFYFISSYY